MKKLNSLIFMLLLFSFTGLISLFPRDERTVEEENRNFNVFPEMSFENMLGGGFGKQFEAWLADRVGWRSDFVNMSRTVVAFAGVEASAPAKEELIVGMEAQINSTAILEPEVEMLAKFIEPEGTGQVSGKLLVFEDRLCEIFYAEAGVSARYADIINSYRAELGDNVRIFSMLAPTQIELLPEKYSALGDSQKEAIESVYSMLAEGITGVNAYNAIAEHTDEYIYFRTDHHWTALGAYYAYEAFAGAAGFESIAIEEYEKIEIPDFLGYLYNAHPTEILAENPDTIEAYSYTGKLETSEQLLYLPGEGEKTSYSLFLGEDKDIINIKTSAGNGKTAVIIKDSYANCFIPWLAPHYENIVVLDPRYFQGSVLEVVNEYEAVDLLFVNYSLSTTFADFTEMINVIR